MWFSFSEALQLSPHVWSFKWAPQPIRLLSVYKVNSGESLDIKLNEVGMLH